MNIVIITNKSNVFKRTCVVGKRKHNDGEDVTEPVAAATLENKHQSKSNHNTEILLLSKQSRVPVLNENKCWKSDSCVCNKVAEEKQISLRMKKDQLG